MFLEHSSPLDDDFKKQNSFELYFPPGAINKYTKAPVRCCSMLIMDTKKKQSIVALIARLKISKKKKL